MINRKQRDEKGEDWATVVSDLFDKNSATLSSTLLPRGDKRFSDVQLEQLSYVILRDLQVSNIQSEPARP